MTIDRSLIGRRCGVIVGWVVLVAACAVSAEPVKTVELPMMIGHHGARTEALLTVGDTVIHRGGRERYRFTGWPDGIGAVTVYGAGTVRVFVNHEFRARSGNPVVLANGTVLPSGSRISWFDIDRVTHDVIHGGQAIRRIATASGDEVNGRNRAAFGVLDRLCSSSLYHSEEGFTEYFLFTGEEVPGGRAFVLHIATGVLHEISAFGYGAWENMAVLPTAGTPAEGLTVMLLADDSARRPLWLYVGEKQPESEDLLEQNGLVDGRVYAFVCDRDGENGINTNAEFYGTGSRIAGTWRRVSDTDPVTDQRGRAEAMKRRVAEAAALGAFMFSRPEDVAFNPNTFNGGQAVLASTGYVRENNAPDMDGDGDADAILDKWGTIYGVNVNFDTLRTDTITGELTILYDGNDAGHGDHGIRSPDNLDWSRDGFIYVQEDRATKPKSLFGRESKREASVWRLDPRTSAALRIAEMDRMAVPAGQTDSKPDDLGNWESSGIVDVSYQFGKRPGSLFLLDVMAHSVGGGVIKSENLVQGGQLLMLDTSRVRDNVSR